MAIYRKNRFLVLICCCVHVFVVVCQWRRSSRWPASSSRSRGSCLSLCRGWRSWATSWRRWGAIDWSLLSSILLLLLITTKPPQLSWSASIKSCRWDSITWPAFSPCFTQNRKNNNNYKTITITIIIIIIIIIIITLIYIAPFKRPKDALHQDK